MSEKKYYCIANTRTRAICILEFQARQDRPWYQNSKIEALEEFIQRTVELLYAAQDRLDGELILETMNHLETLHAPKEEVKS